MFKFCWHNWVVEEVFSYTYTTVDWRGNSLYSDTRVAGKGLQCSKCEHRKLELLKEIGDLPPATVRNAYAWLAAAQNKPNNNVTLLRIVK